MYSELGDTISQCYHGRQAGDSQTSCVPLNTDPDCVDIAPSANRSHVLARRRPDRKCLILKTKPSPARNAVAQRYILTARSASIARHVIASSVQKKQGSWSNAKSSRREVTVDFSHKRGGRYKLRKPIDSHHWGSKLEVQRLFSGKPDLKLKAKTKATKTSQIRRTQRRPR